MQLNIGPFDRTVRFIFGVVLMSWAFIGGPFWTYFGLYLLGTASWKHCPIFWALKRTQSPK